MKKIRDTDYLFLSSYLQAKMAHRGETASDRAAAFEELSRMAPDPQIVDFFRLKYDYHNAKVCLKSIAGGADNSRLLLELGRCPSAVLTESFRTGDFRRLPKDFSAALAEASETMNTTSDPRLADFILDRAYAREMNDVAERTNSAFLKGYAALFADAFNLRALVRMMKSGVRPAQLARVLTDCGSVSLRAVESAYPEPAGVLALYKRTALAPALSEAEAASSGSGFASFESGVRAVLRDYMEQAKYLCFGEEVLIRYLFLIEEPGA